MSKHTAGLIAGVTLMGNAAALADAQVDKALAALDAGFANLPRTSQRALAGQIESARGALGELNRLLDSIPGGYSTNPVYRDNTSPVLEAARTEIQLALSSAEILARQWHAKGSDLGVSYSSNLVSPRIAEVETAVRAASEPFLRAQQVAVAASNSLTSKLIPPGRAARVRDEIAEAYSRTDTPALESLHRKGEQLRNQSLLNVFGLRVGVLGAFLTLCAFIKNGVSSPEDSVEKRPGLGNSAEFARAHVASAENLWQRFVRRWDITSTAFEQRADTGAYYFVKFGHGAVKTLPGLFLAYGGLSLLNQIGMLSSRGSFVLGALAFVGGGWASAALLNSNRNRRLAETRESLSALSRF